MSRTLANAPLAVAAGALLAGVLGAGCGNKDASPAANQDQPAAARPPPDEPVASPEPPRPAPADDSPRLDAQVQKIAEGNSCAGHGKQITGASSASGFSRAGDVWSRSEFWGCGCASGPEFTLLYEPGTSPLVVRLCHDEAKDPCEAGCRQTLVWDLGPALRAARASDIAFADP